MSGEHDGNRPRYYLERQQLEAQQGNPLHAGVTRATRARIAREISEHTHYWHNRQQYEFGFALAQELNRVFLRGYEYEFSMTRLETIFVDLPIGDFFQALEICVSYVTRHLGTNAVDVIRSLLADDLSVFRLVDTVTGEPRFQVMRIDNEHLQSVLTERVFVLTERPELAAAQRDYADAWRHYSKGDLDDAILNAGKSVESACKTVVKQLDPTSAPDHLNLGPLVTLLVSTGVFPTQLTATATHLEQIYRGSGALRNQAGVGHGSLNPTTVEASVALLALRLSGTLVAFLAERLTQMKPSKSS